MKKTLSFILIIATLVACLSSCNFNSNMSGALAGESEATDSVKEMMAALAEERIDGAKSLMHPDHKDKPNSAFMQMSQYLNGRSVKSIKLESINVSNSSGIGGKSRTEQSAFLATLSDGDTVYLSVFYLTDESGSGFSSFQLVLGAI